MNEAAAILFTEELYHISSPATIVLTKPWPEISAAEREQLSKILNALKLSLNGVTILHQPKLDMAALPAKSGRLIYFGSLPAGINHYEFMEARQVGLVASEDLETLIGNEGARKKLWTALRQLFSL
ncbi:MAG: DNA polymerase III subunit psi [Cyclobacteriaceae bacterium]|nr:DNA polymerase III subunit psi [Cyclobacteriaceae bacterium]